MPKIVGIVGSYRKDGVIDRLVTETLAGASELGAETEKIHLLDEHIEFCTNCRQCTQEPGIEPGRCVLDDDMRKLLDLCLSADALVLGAPVNFFNVNALTRRFMERLVCLAYWPWECHSGPIMRIKTKKKKAVLITSTAMPALLVPFFTGAIRALKVTAQTLGFKPATTVVAGLMGDQRQPVVPEKILLKVRKAGRKLAQG